MAEVYGWSIQTDAGDEINLSVRDFDDDESLVQVEESTAFSGSVTALLTPKEARELARDLNAAAKAAASK